MFAHGGAGAEDLAREVVATVGASKAGKPAAAVSAGYALGKQGRNDRQTDLRSLGRGFHREAAAKFKKAARLGYGNLPICMAKTQNSLSDNPKLLGLEDFTITVRDMEILRGPVSWWLLRAISSACGPARTPSRRADRRRRFGQDPESVLIGPAGFDVGGSGWKPLPLDGNSCGCGLSADVRERRSRRSAREETSSPDTGLPINILRLAVVPHG